MKKKTENEVQVLEVWCIILALAVCVLGILFLFNLTQNYWFLNFIFGLGVLLHVSLSLLFRKRQRTVPLVLSIILTILCFGCLIYFNIRV